MKDTFLKHALPAVLKFEGGYSNNPNDSGGATNYGITHTEYDAWRAAEGLPHDDIRNISMETVQHIYKAKYWDAVHGDNLAYPMDWILFDTAVNMGVGVAALLLTRALGLPEQHAMTTGLVSAANARCSTLPGTHTLKTSYLQKRIDYYHAIVANNPKDAEFLDGWLNRVDGLRNET